MAWKGAIPNVSVTKAQAKAASFDNNCWSLLIRSENFGYQKDGVSNGKTLTALINSFEWKDKSIKKTGSNAGTTPLEEYQSKNLLRKKF
jgi:hypothetical protein